MTQSTVSSQFFTNRGGNTLMKEFEGILQNNPQIRHLDAVVGFLRASGYFSLRPFLNSIDKARILIGIDVDKYIAEATRRGTIFFGAGEEVKKDYLSGLRSDIENAPYAKQIEEGIMQMAQDIADGKLEVRAHPSKKIHAKLYVLYPDNFNQYAGGMAITGSSNLSGNGLGISEEKQYEFNVKLNRYDDVAFARDEFEQLWGEAVNCEISADDVKTTIGTTYLKSDVAPYDLYIKMLMEYFANRQMTIDDEEAEYIMPQGYTKYEYQMDAVSEGYQKLLRYNGFFLADVVGLGKTVVATMIARKFLIMNGRENTKILVVYPPAVEKNWKETFHDFGIDTNAKFIPNGSLSKVLDEENRDYWNADEYDLILVDEAHKFRTRDTQSFNDLQAICKMPRVSPGGVPGYKKKVMLISATPMNNTPSDIYNQIMLFQDPRHCTIDGVSNLTAFLSPLIKEFKQYRKDTEAHAEEFKKLAEQVRDRIIKPITVRRTRTDIENIPRYRNEVGQFPQVEQPNESRYELNEKTADLFEQAMHILTGELLYARYQAIAYLKPEISKKYYDNAERVSHNLAGICKNGLVKRLESSFFAFKESLQTFKQANRNMIDMFAHNKVYITPDLDINAMIEAGLTEEEIEEKISRKAETNPNNAIFEAKDFRPGFIDMLRRDQDILDRMCADWDSVSDDDDSKFARFDDMLQHELFRKDINPGQKLVVFSESIDTIKYLKQRLQRKDVLLISAENRDRMFNTILENFDANYSKEQKNTYNILLTTDALSEGVNLHRSNVIVNYDTPWNSTRLIQRIGRVNRIGSKSNHIYNYVFYPSRQGNKEINLTQISLSKIQIFHTTYGEDNKIYSGEEVIERDLSKLFDEAINAGREEANLELPYFEELRNLYLNNRREYNRIAKMSLRSRTGRSARAVDTRTLSNNTLVFLKTNLRKVFYLVDEDAAHELSVLDALSYFKAEPSEPQVPRIPSHHEQVEKALQAFNSRLNEDYQAQESPQPTNNMGTQVQTAISLIAVILREIEDPDLYQKVARLKTLVERGVIAYLAKRLQRIQKQLKKKQLTHDEAVSEVIELSRKYAPYYLAEEQLLKENNETDAHIILSESFQ